MTQTIRIHDQHFDLHPSGAAFWLEREMLMIADVHFGKVTHFRKNGSAVPVAASEENFKRLREIVKQYEPRVVCFLGDLFHSSYNNEWLPFEDWVNSFDSEVWLVSGNHDIIDTGKYVELGVRVMTELLLEPFLLTHHPTETETYFNFSGHVHPAVRMLGRGRQQLKLACFFKTANQLILPAFGTFTGKHTLVPKKEDEIFLIAEGTVVNIN